MSRRHARKRVMRILYQREFLPADSATERLADPYAEQLLSGISEHAQQIDHEIEVRLAGWRLDRLHSVDRSLLRLAVYELLYCPETPPEVIIDEAVELAKAYGTENSPGFINGLLDRVHHECERSSAGEPLG